MVNILYLLAMIPMVALAGAGNGYEACIEGAYGAADVVHCMNKEQERLEGVVRQRAGRLRSCLPEKRRGEIDLLDAAWNEWRDARCGLFIGASGGSGDVEDAAECMVKAASDYADDLHAFVDRYCSR